MNSHELIRDLRDIERLIALLYALDDMDEEDLQDLRWLQATHRSLAALLAFRQAEGSKKIISLELWRQGDAAASMHAVTAGTSPARIPDFDDVVAARRPLEPRQRGQIHAHRETFDPPQCADISGMSLDRLSCVPRATPPNLAPGIAARGYLLRGA